MDPIVILSIRHDKMRVAAIKKGESRRRVRDVGSGSVASASQARWSSCFIRLATSLSVLGSRFIGGVMSHCVTSRLRL